MHYMCKLLTAAPLRASEMGLELPRNQVHSEKYALFHYNDDDDVDDDEPHNASL